MVQFTEPQVILFVRDPEQAATFYSSFGFVESFRTPQANPVKIEMTHGDFTLGLATPESAAAAHAIEANSKPNRAVVVLWTDDVPAAYKLALDAGARDIQAPHIYRDTLLMAFVEDLDGHPMHLVCQVDG
ncbi:MULTISPECIES: VOC family protein [unclassified Brevibacterium]|uniref:VOC family protein n=1 Tax=unclassified Brevibacterium TaxID=2614124 RepID=UPI0010F5931F|nr:VOC family protein [Brevibacterium sp. 2SA]MCM1011709.1 VOC family protein [Brevibacterium sp. XM4083]